LTKKLKHAKLSANLYRIQTGHLSNSSSGSGTAHHGGSNIGEGNNTNNNNSSSEAVQFSKLEYNFIHAITNPNERHQIILHMQREWRENLLQRLTYLRLNFDATAWLLSIDAIDRQVALDGARVRANKRRCLMGRALRQDVNDSTPGVFINHMKEDIMMEYNHHTTTTNSNIGVPQSLQQTSDDGVGLSHTNNIIGDGIGNTHDTNNIRNIKIFNYGFSDKAGTENLYFDPKLSVNASLANLSDSADAVKVACHFDTLDHFIFSKGLHVDFIKCDVEGAELLVFKGGREVIARDKPVVFSEMLRKWSAKFDYHPNEIIELFNSLGYSCYTIANEVLSSCSHVDESTVETNFFFLHNTEHNYILNNTGITGIK
jgi:FkbM family methyltransferase